MTENKRFTVDKDGRTILDNIDDSYCECVDGYEAKQYCDKLNELNDENKELKSDRDYWKTLAQSLAKNNGGI